MMRALECGIAWGEWLISPVLLGERCLGEVPKATVSARASTSAVMLRGRSQSPGAPGTSLLDLR